MYIKTAVLTLSLLLAASGGAYAYEAQTRPYPDVTAQDWANENVYTLSALGIIEGYPDLNYHPGDRITREAFIKLLAATAKLDISHAAGTLPADVAGRWSAPYVSAASERHWIDFMVNGSGQLMPEQMISREEVAALIGKYLLDRAGASGSQWIAGDWTKERDARAFADGSAIDSTIAPSVYFAVNRGIMEGDLQGFRPKDRLTRREAAAVINRLIDKDAETHKLEMTGFYAVKSSPALGRMPLLDDVAMGWSHLDYTAPGTAKLDMETTEYKVPEGFDTVVQAADRAHVRKDLMVYTADGKKLSDFLKDAAAEKTFIDQLAAELGDSRFGFTGVSLDFEGLIDASDAPGYLQFIRDVKAALGGKTLTVVVPTDFYYKGYDFKGIGVTADTVVLMAYDFTHDESRIPSAPLPYVREGLDRALLGVPKEKLVLGISKQAVQWVTADGVTKRERPAIDLVEKRLTDPAALQTWSLPYFLKRISYQEGSVSNEIYYEDAQSIAKKIWLAKAYGLKGVSLWYMGNFTAADWEVIGKR